MTEPAWAGKWSQDFFDWWDNATDDERRDYLRRVPEWMANDARHPDAIRVFGTWASPIPWRDMTIATIRRTFPGVPVGESPDREEFVRMYDDAKKRSEATRPPTEAQ
jgi:hypothetical protein